jgi:hypothetical protein
MQALSIAAKEYVCAATNQRLTDPYRILPCLCVVNLSAITSVGQNALEKLPSVCPNPSCQMPVMGILQDKPKSRSAKLFYEVLDKGDVYPVEVPQPKIPGPRCKFISEIDNSTGWTYTVHFTSTGNSLIKYFSLYDDSPRPINMVVIKPIDANNAELTQIMASKGFSINEEDKCYYIEGEKNIKRMIPLLLDSIDLDENDKKIILKFASGQSIAPPKVATKAPLQY